MEGNFILAEDKQNLIVGYKQVSKAIKNGTCKKIFVAMDSSSLILDSLLENTKDIEVVEIPTMRELGNECEIDVPASCAALIRL